jgi:hypothetical protein
VEEEARKGEETTAELASDTQKALEELQQQWNLKKHRRDSEGKPI